jgi:hypothetical protein
MNKAYGAHASAATASATANRRRKYRTAAQSAIRGPTTASIRFQNGAAWLSPVKYRNPECPEIQRGGGQRSHRVSGCASRSRYARVTMPATNAKADASRGAVRTRA